MTLAVLLLVSSPPPDLELLRSGTSSALPTPRDQHRLAWDEGAHGTAYRGRRRDGDIGSAPFLASITTSDFRS